MPKTATVTVRLDPKVKQDAQKILDKLGITTSQAVTMYFNQISAEKGLPFRPHILNAETEHVIQNARAGKNLHTAKDIDDLFAQLES
jgi:DNA-damage-inducible protein J